MDKLPGEPSHLEWFDQQRGQLFAIAYQMLGTYHEAEDLLQDVFIQWQGLDLDEVQSPKAMLKTLTVRRATDVLRKAYRQREEYIGPWLPGPWVSQGEDSSAAHSNPHDRRELLDSLSVGFMMLMEQLSPTERAVYILRSGFDLNYREISQYLDLSEANCRQLFSRAKSRLKSSPKGNEVRKDLHHTLLQKFIDTVEMGDVSGFADHLAEEVVLYSDGGGKAVAALRPIYGKDKVTRLLTGLARKWQKIGPRFSMVEVNGRPGLLWMDSDSVQTVVAIETGTQGVAQIFLMRNPDKIAHVQQLVLNT